METITIKHLTSNPRILSMAECIENRVGTAIEIAANPPERQKRAPAFLGWNHFRRCFTLLIIPEAPPSDMIISHELMHAIMAIEGFPSLITLGPMPDYINYKVVHTFDTVMHVDVWQMQERFGFSEKEQFNYGIEKMLIPRMERGDLFSDVPHGEGVCHLLCHLCAVQFCPADVEIKQRALAMAPEALGKFYPNFQRCCDKIYAALPLNASNAFTLFESLLSEFQFHGQVCAPAYNIVPPTKDFREIVYNSLCM
ncbi:MAG: hypothetical protein RRY29_10240 [Desulfovibrionaceae bacterium]